MGCSTVEVTMSRLICNARSPGFWIQLPKLLQLLRILWLMGATAIGGSVKVTATELTHTWRLSSKLTPMHPWNIKKYLCASINIPGNLGEMKAGTMFHAFSWSLLDLHNFYVSLSLMWTLIVLSKKSDFFSCSILQENIHGRILLCPFFLCVFTLLSHFQWRHLRCFIYNYLPSPPLILSHFTLPSFSNSLSKLSSSLAFPLSLSLSVAGVWLKSIRVTARDVSKELCSEWMNCAKWYQNLTDVSNVRAGWHCFRRWCEENLKRKSYPWVYDDHTWNT